MTVSKRTAVNVCALSLILLFLPGIGDIRFAGLIVFIYVGIPLYVLSTVDSVTEDIQRQGESTRFRSPTLMVFGLVCIGLGLLIDWVLIMQLIEDPSPASFGQIALRAIAGFPFIGFGMYLLYLAWGHFKQ